MQKIQIKNLTWVDIVDPKKEDILYLQSLDFHPVVLKELQSPTLRPKVEEYDNYLYMVLHFPIYHPKEKTSKSMEIDFLITKYSLITVRYGKIQPLQELWGKCQFGNEDSLFNYSAASVLYYILQELNKFSFRQIDHITKKINALEGKIFKNHNSKNEEKLVEEISIIRRDILDFRRTLKPQETILNSLRTRSINFFGQITLPYFDDIIGDHLRVWELLDNHKEAIESLQESHNSLLSNKTNRIIKVLTLFTGIMLPLSLLAGIFGMNTRHDPIIGNRYDFWIISGLMFILAIIMIIIFKKKKWL
ncbi:MAG TPA: magnesium transporter CorA family protein [Candidatus Portnoybacteria bacterium]|nr:magnesium transporter CorA family protein [Candidatus Portnoybacteria bacterium]